MSLPPLSVTVSAKRWSLVLDAGLALSRYGMLLAQRLGEEFDLWLVREMWRILDNIECYPDPEKLIAGGGGAERGAGNEDFHLILKQWEWARTASDLSRLKWFWVGDARYESLHPPGMDGNLVYRFEKLAAGLDRRQGPEAETGSDLFRADSFRDALALTAALTPYRAFILTSYGDDDPSSSTGWPAICTYFAQVTGCQPEMIKGENRFLRDYLHPILLRSGINELLWTKVKLAAVHLLVPEAVVLPPPEKEDGFFGEETETAGDQHLWRDAACFWYPI